MTYAAGRNTPVADDGQALSLAVLIDADNTRPLYAKAVFEEIVKLGEASVRRIYGDFSSGRLTGWNGAVESLAILQHQQRSNTTGKNAADIALVIDAMDLMHKGKLDGFCLVSSDSDFTRLAQRLREDGLQVYGFGERKTPETFRNACHRFIYVENLVESVPEKEASGSDASPQIKESPGNAVDIIANALEGTDDDGWVNLSSIGSRIVTAMPDFDPRTYGCPSLSTLVKACGGFEIRKELNNRILIRRKVAQKASRGKKKKTNT